MWDVTEEDLTPAAIGAAILGTGGGGNPYLGRLRARAELRAGKKIEIIDPTEIADDDLLVAVGGMGSPVVAYEKVAGGNEETDAVRALERYLGRRFTAIAPFEMGGGNSMVPLVVGARLGIPVVDGDGMGRAFPELQMITYLIYGGSPFPAALADERGNRIVVDRILDAHWLERILRSVTIDMGGHAGLANAVMDGAFCRKTIIPNTLSLAIRIGRAGGGHCAPVRWSPVHPRQGGRRRAARHAGLREGTRGDRRVGRRHRTPRGDRLPEREPGDSRG